MATHILLICGSSESPWSASLPPTMSFVGLALLPDVSLRPDGSAGVATVSVVL
jgi:hypothetical protein